MNHFNVTDPSLLRQLLSQPLVDAKSSLSPIISLALDTTRGSRPKQQNIRPLFNIRADHPLTLHGAPSAGSNQAFIIPSPPLSWMSIKGREIWIYKPQRLGRIPYSLTWKKMNHHPTSLHVPRNWAPWYAPILLLVVDKHSPKR